MSNKTLGPGEHTRVTRLPKKANYDEKIIHTILDEARMCHVAGIVGEKAMALPTLHARKGSTLYLHGSQSNAIMKSVLVSGEAFVTVTHYDGLRLARSGFESSIAYRSVVIFGPVTEVTDLEEKRKCLDMFVDAILPGRADEVRPMNERELHLTFVLAVEINEASAKISAGPTEDFEYDVDLPIWSGTIPSKLVFGEPVPNTDGAMATGEIELPSSVQRLLENQ